MPSCPPDVKTAVVLAAGNLPAALTPVFGRTSPAMLPVNGRPIIHWQLNYLHELGITEVVIGVRPEEMRLPRFVRQAFGRVLNVVCEPIPEDAGPGYTLLKCLERIPESTPCLVVLGDTLFKFGDGQGDLFAENFVLTGPVEDAHRWCLVRVDDRQHVAELADKPAKNPDAWPALVGVYFLKDTAPARNALRAQRASGERSLQLRHALQPYVEHGGLRAHAAGEWLDCGNLDFLTSSRRRLLQERSFNSIQIDELRGTITKRSQHLAKFLNEINYYRQLPPDLAIFFPRLVDFSLRPEDVFLTLEYYGYPTLSEIWVFEEYPPEYWRMIFRSLARIIECFGCYSVSLAPAASFNFYWRKTCDRIEEFVQQSDAAREIVSAESLELNGQRLRGWPAVRDETERRVRAIAANTVGQIIHGDLCFPNILYDPLSRLFKFIDPRGSFGESGLFGDPRYDVAKLFHSLDGGYDFLIHDMYAWHQEGLRLNLHCFFPDSRETVMNLFLETFCRRHDFREIRLIEGLLFLSMCPLHPDHPRRQAAMFATGLRILNQLLSE
jgi:dTDP-glucose pyrophosphorylase